MKHAKLFLCFLIMYGFWTGTLAQSTIPATGGNASGSGGSVSFSVGQITYNELSGIDGIVLQGVQQPYEISVVTFIENSNSISLEYAVYPNPTKGIIKLNVESIDNVDLRFRLYDINGVLLIDKKVESKETEISLGSFSSSLYLLKITNNNKEVKVFKIVKN